MEEVTEKELKELKKQIGYHMFFNLHYFHLLFSPCKKNVFML